VAVAILPASVSAEYKPEFTMSIVVINETPWGTAATRFADAVKFQTQGRIQIKPYFNGQLLAGKQGTEFLLLQQGPPISPSDRRLTGLHR
jgi:TRAP-type C4-dicarboxylate transport system substrate-binding protein